MNWINQISLKIIKCTTKLQINIATYCVYHCQSEQCARTWDWGNNCRRAKQEKLLIFPLISEEKTNYPFILCLWRKLNEINQQSEKHIFMIYTERVRSVRRLIKIVLMFLLPFGIWCFQRLSNWLNNRSLKIHSLKPITADWTIYASDNFEWFTAVWCSMYDYFEWWCSATWNTKQQKMRNEFELLLKFV